MSTYAPGDSITASRGSNTVQSETVQDAQDRKEAQHSMEITHAKTEAPKVPDQIYKAFERLQPEIIPIGNTQYELSLRLAGKLGTFLDRANTAKRVTAIPLFAEAYRAGARSTLRDVLYRQLLGKQYIESDEIIQRIDYVSTILANGISVLTYLKLRAVNTFTEGQFTKFNKKPKVPVPFEVPLPYALAISQLGIVKVSSLPKELILVPTIPSDAGQNFLLPAGVAWSPTKYAETVEYAKSIGMQFATVDLQVKLGSSWWLYNQVEDEGIFTLKCILPEDNYTEATAVLHTLFCMNENRGPRNEFFDLSSLDQVDYGSMLRNPAHDVSINTYYAIEADPAAIWSIV